MRRKLVALALAIAISGWGSFSPAVSAQTQQTQQSKAESDFEGLAEGPGREAVYFTCTACHSLKQFSQQAMARDEWSAVIDRMIKDNGMATPQPWARTIILSYLSTHFAAEEEEDWGGLPPGEGREEVFYTCQACHSLKTVLQQRLSKDAWDETLEWMIEEQGMPEPETDEYALILNYLGTRLAP